MSNSGASSIARSSDGLYPVHAPRAIQVLSRTDGRLFWGRLEDRRDQRRVKSSSGGALQGRYLLHCHNLEHEDHSMMARVDVV